VISPGEPRTTGYADLAARLRKRITSGEFAPGQRLPAEPQLMHAYDVGRDTVRRATRVLRSEGLVEYIRGWGMVVRESRVMEEVQLEPGCRVKARPADAEERDRYGEGVVMVEVRNPDGTGDTYPGDRTVFVT
jgi:DNA-binding FadR family transcriptional regulator